MSVYALKDPRDGRVRYVGCSRWPKRRLVRHIWGAHSEALRQWIAELAPLRPQLVITRFRIEMNAIRELRPDLNQIRGLSYPRVMKKRGLIASDLSS